MVAIVATRPHEQLVQRLLLRVHDLIGIRMVHSKLRRRLRWTSNLGIDHAQHGSPKPAINELVQH